MLVTILLMSMVIWAMWAFRIIIMMQFYKTDYQTALYSETAKLKKAVKRGSIASGILFIILLLGLSVFKVIRIAHPSYWVVGASLSTWMIWVGMSIFNYFGRCIQNDNKPRVGITCLAIMHVVVYPAILIIIISNL